MRWLIDDSGEVFSPTSGNTFLLQLGVPHSEKSEEYAIANIGCIAVTMRASWHIRFRPSLVSGRALAALMYLLLDHPDRPIVVTWLDDIWKMERAVDARAGIALISYLMDRKASPMPGPRIKSVPSKRARERWHRVRESFERRVETSGFDTSLYALLNTTFVGRWGLIEVDSECGAIVMHERGDGYPPLHRMLRSERNFNFANIEDPTYRDWLMETYLDVVRKQEPRFDDIDAIITWPRFGDVRTRYWRILAPLVTPAGSCRLLTASGNDSGIDLRPSDLEEMAQVFSGVGR